MTDTVFVKILEKEYQVACPPEEVNALQQAARDLDQRMRSIRSNSSVIGLERIAVMAALNLSHELQQAREQARSNTGDSDSIKRLSEKIETALANLA